MLVHNELKSRLEIAQVGDNVIEICSCTEKLKLARYIKLKDQNLSVLSVDVVERVENENFEQRLEIGDRGLYYKTLTENVLNLNVPVRKIELVFYKNPDVVELISVRVLLEGEIQDQDVLRELYLKVLEKFAPKFLEKLFKIVQSCQ